jgi:hypothetical protein
MGSFTIFHLLILVILALMFAVYITPSLIAYRRKQPNLGVVMAVNLLLGWTIAGWLVALYWSLKKR